MTDGPFFAELAKIASLKSQLTKCPAEVYQARLLLAEALDRLRDAKEACAEYEAEQMALIRAERKETGTVLHGAPKEVLRYPNDAARAEALTHALATAPAYAVLKKTLRATESEKTAAEFGLKRFEDQMRAVQYVAELTCAEVRLLVAR